MQPSALRLERLTSRPLLLVLGLILCLALFLRIYHLDKVPPGVHDDEIINGEIALAAAGGDVELFYPAGWGREGLYHLLLAGSFRLPLPIHWRLRLPSVLCSLIGVLLTWVWVRRAFGPWAAVTASGGMAVALWPVLLGRAALRATTLLPLASAAAWLMTRLLRKESSRADPWLLGLLVGLSLYTYRAARVLPFVYLAFALHLISLRKPAWSRVVLALIGAAVVAAPLVFLLSTNPGIEPRIDQVNQPWQALLAGDIGPVLKGVWATLGMFGWRGDPQGHYNLPARPVFGPVGAALFLIGIVVALWRWRQPIYAFALAWLAIGLAPGMITEPVPHFVHTVTAQGVVMSFPAIAIEAIAGRASRRAKTILGAALALWIAGNAVWTYNDLLIEWPQVDQVRSFHQADVADVAHYLDNDPQISPVAICTSFLNETDPFWRGGRQAMPFLLSRQDLAIRWYNCQSAQVWPDAGQTARYLFLHQAAFAPWIPAEWLLDGHMIEDDSYQGVSIRLAEPLAHHLAQLAGPGPVNLGDQLLYLGYEPLADRASPGDQLALRTYWQVLGPLPPDLSIFLHLLGDSPAPLAQGDALALLSDTLQPADVMAQEHLLSVPADLAPGDYVLSVGIYSRTDRHPRLQVRQDGMDQADHLLMDHLLVGN